MPLLSIFVLLWASLLSSQAVTANTEDTYRQVSPSVLQVLILDKTSGSKSSFGSGFFVEGGFVITNFHVISDLVFHPERHRAEYRNADDERGGLTLIHFDVVNDLAIMRSDDYVGPSLAIAETPPQNGSRIYAMGHPHDLGLSVVEGTYNGLLAQNMIPRIHLTGSLNPGMSGGPALERANELVGVNVARMGNQVSFLVPASYVIRLMEQSDEDGVDDVDLAVDFRKRVSEQIARHQKTYLEPIIQQPFARISLGAYSAAGELSGAFECWGSTSEPDERLYSSSSYKCETAQYIYLTTDDYTGTVEYRHEYFHTEELGAQRFYAFLEKHMQTIHAETSADEKYATNFSCQQALVENNAIDMKLVSCVRAHRIIDDLYDFFLLLTTVEQEDEALYSVLMLAGVSHDNGVRFQRRYLDAISYGEADDAR